MKQVSRLIAALPLMALLAACGPSQLVVPKQAGGNPTQALPQVAPGVIQLTGAGATFPAPIYQKWFYDYAFVDNSAQFNYQGIGSGGGIKAITEKTVDFGGSDAILNANQKAAAPDVLMFPTVAGAVTISYNLKNDGVPVSGLKLDGPTIADIFLGKIKKWDDPALVALNPDLRLPDEDIVVAHRSDGSGTTFLFTNFLARVSDDWKNGPGAGTAIKWPVGLGGKGNPGVAAIVSDQPYSLGYIDLSDAAGNDMEIASVRNASGAFVRPTIDSVIAAQDSFAASMPDDMGQLILDSDAPDAYPITGYTFLLLRKDMPDCAKAAAIVRWFHWALSSGDSSARDMHYAPLGDDVQQRVETRLDTLTCEGGKPILQTP